MHCNTHLHTHTQMDCSQMTVGACHDGKSFVLLVHKLFPKRTCHFENCACVCIVILQIVCMAVNKEREEWLWQPRRRTADALEIRNTSVTAIHLASHFPLIYSFLHHISIIYLLPTVFFFFNAIRWQHSHSGHKPDVFISRRLSLKHSCCHSLSNPIMAVNIVIQFTNKYILWLD